MNHGRCCRSIRWLVELAIPSRIPGDESWSDADKRILLRNEAQLNCVSLRSRFDCVARRGLSRVKMNALAGALDSPLPRRGKSVLILLDNADVVIDGMLSAYAISEPLQGFGITTERASRTSLGWADEGVCPYASGLDVQVLYVQGVFLDELAA